MIPSLYMRMGRVALVGAAGVPWVLLLANPATQSAHKKVDYSQDVAPIFRAHCVQCHGADSQMGKLRLDTVAGFKRGGSTGVLVEPGKAAKSYLMERILGQGGPRMPMGFAPLTTEETATIRQWINEGASLAGASNTRHWAYIKPERPEAPKVKNKTWVRNPIDGFVLAKLESLGLKPSPAAPKATLLRRVYLDLTGLPPSVDETNRFLADTRPDAYESIVDSLLASPAYGERMATPWLDMARYADSMGYEKDLNRTMWPYRDWVINAFNRDMPFDEFTIEQIAGDLLPNPTKDQRVATGFHRNTMTNTEGGVDQGEQRWLTLVDRVGTTGSVWLGTTLACAQCHNHKYDPISQEDFYRFLAFYDPSNEPTLDLSDPKLKTLSGELSELEKSLPKLSGDAEALKAANGAAQSLRNQINEMSSVSTLVMEEKKDQYPPKTPMRIRGAYLAPGALVQADVPKVLPRMSKDLPDNRLGLAKWLVSRENPLTARVRINQIWEQVFGIGLVKTVEDLGTQGEKPLQKDLLDWLACEFMAKGWSMKAMMKLIVTSNTYRQSSAESAVMKERDPENRLLARGPRFRMPAEMIRDCALKASGLLSEKLGGPSVYPDQPDGIWNTPYNDQSWQSSKGEDRYRRGLYTFWKRTSPYPSFLSFDATSHESCTVRRIRTNTPLQALTLLNDPVYLMSAKALAKKMISADKLTTGDKIQLGFESVVARRPSPRELARLSQLLQQEQAHFSQNPEDAAKLMGTAKPAPSTQTEAAYTLVAQVIFNLDEAITKE